MSLTEKINQDIKAAMLAKEKGKLEALRAIKAALLLEATKEGGGEITVEAEMSILKKLYKQRRDAAAIYIEQNRPDLAETEVFQADVIEAYLPEQMSEEAIGAVIEGVIAKIGAQGPSDMGKVMGAAMGQLNGKADGGLISKVVKEKLAAL
ncbi:MAG: GatB/YqeY domain-containing protein [Flavobacteriales bacterium]|nr:GatB/YqeY domain-containing protein [Flavobacteriales bacterium]